MSATFTSLAYNLTTLRERGILKRLRGTPLPTSPTSPGWPATRSPTRSLQLAIVIVVGHVAARRRRGRRDWVALAVFVGAGVVCFALLGVALSHAIPNPESAPAYVNAVFLPQILIAGVFYDDENAPAVIHDIAQVLPLTHLVDGLSGAMVDGRGGRRPPDGAARAGPVDGGRRRARGARLLLGSAQRSLTRTTDDAPLAI